MVETDYWKAYSYRLGSPQENPLSLILFSLAISLLVHKLQQQATPVMICQKYFTTQSYNHDLIQFIPNLQATPDVTRIITEYQSASGDALKRVKTNQK